MLNNNTADLHLFWVQQLILKHTKQQKQKHIIIAIIIISTSSIVTERLYG